MYFDSLEQYLAFQPLKVRFPTLRILLSPIEMNNDNILIEVLANKPSFISTYLSFCKELLPQVISQ